MYMWMRACTIHVLYYCFCTQVMYKEPTPGVDENGKKSAETVLSAINDGSIANVKEESPCLLCRFPLVSSCS